jgi:hypothetical protein
LNRHRVLAYVCAMGFDDVARRMKERHRGEVDYAAPSVTTEPDRMMAGAASAGQRANGSEDIAFGALLLIVGIAITGITHNAASRDGGTYVLAYGPMIVGAIKILRGLSRFGG